MNRQEPLTAPGTLVPPRPNLGPEPLNRSSPWDAWPIPAGLAVFGLVFWIARRIRARRNQPRRMTVPAPPVPADPIEALADSVRARLVARFGEAWRARTTEEIAGSPAIAEALGPDAFARLVAFLQAVDVVKYSGRERADSDAIRAAWSEWAAHFLSGAEGARSTSTGK